MEQVEWREPPVATKSAPNAGKGRWYRTLDALRERPGEWAYCGTAPRPTTTHIMRGRLGGAEPGEFEATSRQREDGKYDIYARYVGGESA